MDIEHIAKALHQDGYIIVSDFLDETLVQQLYQRVISLPEADFQLAQIGRQLDRQSLLTVRNDRTAWLSEQHPIEQAYLSLMHALMTMLNQQLFLGLRYFEAHFAHYPVGHFYHRHLDAFRGQSNRILSSVFYLNPDWQKEQGGELVLYQNDDELLRLMPQWGTMVLFLSEQFPHEVIAAHRDRYSIAGWFRQDRFL